MDDIKPELEKIIDFLKGELGNLRTGRANPALVENIEIDYYGSKSPLKQIASIGTPGPREIVIQPWSKDNLVDIEKAIAASGVNLSPVNTGDAIRINIPPLTEESRAGLVKILKEKMEEARIKVRKARDDARKDIQEAEQAKEISEDERFKEFENLDKTTEEYNKKIDEIGKEKEEEIITV